jgi:large subunit ribosomal protein L6
MSRIGKQPITIKPGVTVEIADKNVTVRGPRGELNIEIPRGVKIEQKEGMLEVTRRTDADRAEQGLFRSLVQNMVDGVTEGFVKELEIVGVGYRVRLAGQDLEFNLGFSHQVLITPPEGIVFEVPTETEIKILGNDKQKVGEIAAKIRKLRKPEPYKGKGIRYKGEYVKIKQSKAATTGA